MLEYNKIPYLFYDIESINEHIKAFEEFCRNTQKCNPFPAYLKTVIKWILSNCYYYQNTSSQIYSILEHSTNRKVALLNYRMEAAQETIDDFKEQISDNFNETITTQSNNITELANQTKKNIEESEKKASETSITILGIFAAVVLVFNSAISFSDEVLEAFVNSNIYKAVIITLIFGLIIGNMVLGLLSYLESIRKNQNMENNARDKKRKNNAFNIAILVNSVIVVCLLATVILWWNNIVGKRDNKYHPETTTSIVTTIEDNTTDGYSSEESKYGSVFGFLFGKRT